MDKKKTVSSLNEFEEWCLLEIALWKDHLKKHAPSSQIYRDSKLVLMGMSYTLASVEIYKQQAGRRCPL